MTYVFDVERMTSFRNPIFQSNTVFLIFLIHMWLFNIFVVFKGKKVKKVQIINEKRTLYLTRYIIGLGCTVIN